MDNIELGKRIKEARLAKKLTQSDVVGDFITRNMLSQIESGTAFPSIKTLEYLSKVLEVPMYSLMPDEVKARESSPESRSNDYLIETLLCGKTQYRAKMYESTITIITPLLNETSDNGDVGVSLYKAPLYDEAVSLLARAYLGFAIEQREQGKLQQAAQNAKRASELAVEGVYSSRDIRTQALLLLDEIYEKL